MSKTSEPLRRAAAIAELVAMEPNGMTVARIAQNLALPVPTAFRVVRKLVDIGFLEGEGRHTAYVVGPRLRQISGFISGGSSFSMNAERELQALADNLGVSVYLAGLFEDKVSLFIVKLPSVIRSPSVHPGPTFQTHASASGKMILAHQPPAKISTLLEKPLERLTERTITDPDELRSQLVEIRERGFAVAIGESDPSLWGIAVPVTSPSGSVNYSLGLITFRSTIDDNEAYIETVRPKLAEAANRLTQSIRIGFM